MSAFSERLAQIERKLYGKARELLTFGTEDLADDSVTAAKIAAGAVGTTELADDAVTQAKIGAGAVGTTELADSAVTTAKLNIPPSSYTPTLSQGVSDIAKTVYYSKYWVIDGLCTWNFRIQPTAGGTSSNELNLTLPVTAASDGCVIGAGMIYDASAGPNWNISGIWLNSNGSTTLIRFNADNSGTFGTTPTTAIASGDYLRGSITYEI